MNELKMYTQEQEGEKDEKVSVFRGSQRSFADPGQDILGE